MKLSKLIYEVATNDADYNVYKYENLGGKQRLVWTCPYYLKRKGMLTRCYSTKELERYPTYKGCYVCNEWLTFSNFKSWMEGQDWQDWKGKHLDKDFLVEGNKMYSPATCVFISGIVNTFVIDRGNGRGELPVGVSLKQDKYRSQCRDPFKTRSHHIGYFVTPKEAHLAWKERKHKYAVELANSQYVTDERVRQVLLTKYS